MNIKQMFKTMLIGMICSSFVTCDAIGKQSSTRQDSGGAQLPVVVRPPQDDTPRDSFLDPEDRDPTQGQAILLNTKYAGWEGASETSGGDRIVDEIRANWIMVDANGRFEGKVVPGRGAEVTNMNVFLMNKGRLVKQTSVNEDGQFEFNNVRQGAYALIGWGDKGLFAFGVNILAHNPDADESYINAVTVAAFQNITTINIDWIRHYAAQVSYRVYGRYGTGEGRDDPESLYGFKGLVMNLPEASPATSISNHTVNKTVDGRLVGRVHQFNSISGRPVDVRTTKVLLLEGDDVVASTTTDNFGTFEFHEVPDGSYGLVAAGVDGVGLLGINVGPGEVETNDLGEIAQSTAPIDFTMVSSETIGWLKHNADAVAYQRAIVAPRHNPAQFNPHGCSQCGNQAGGCAACQSQYANSCCRSRGITFEQWQQMGCHCNSSDTLGLGDGLIISEVAKAVRRRTERTSDLFDRAFYSSEFEGGGLGAGNNFQPGFGQTQGFAQPGF